MITSCGFHDTQDTINGPHPFNQNWLSKVTRRGWLLSELTVNHSLTAQGSKGNYVQNFKITLSIILYMKKYTILIGCEQCGLSVIPEKIAHRNFGLWLAQWKTIKRNFLSQRYRVEQGLMLAVNGHVQLRSVCGNLIYNSRILFQVDSNEEYDIEKGGNERGIEGNPRTKEAWKNRRISDGWWQS